MDREQIDSEVQTVGSVLADATPDADLGVAGAANGAGKVTTSDSASVPGGVEQFITARFRCPRNTADFVIDAGLSRDSGHFLIGPRTIGFGQCSSGTPAKLLTEPLHDAGEHIINNGSSSIHLPFDPVQIVDNLRSERYAATATGIKTLPSSTIFRNLYYFARPFLRTSARRCLQKLYFRGWERIPFPKWPVDVTVENVFEQLLVLSMHSRNVKRTPFIWFWPDGARSCTMMTHDVETSAGRDYSPQLMDLNDSFGIKSSFQIVPEKRYTVSQHFVENMQQRGFEVNVHDLNHDGRLMCEREEFLRRAERINFYGRQFGARGFRSAVMYRNLDWYDALEFSYDMSIPNVAHLDPQQGGCCTVLPFFVGNIVELPLTTTQDYSLFHVLNQYSTQLWREQISSIRQEHGLVSFSVHPDYVIERPARRVYEELLGHLAELRSQGGTWIALPNEIAVWWRLRSQLQLVNAGDSWQIEGEGKNRARLAYAAINDNGALTYELANDSEAVPRP